MSQPSLVFSILPREWQEGGRGVGLTKSDHQKGVLIREGGLIEKGGINRTFTVFSSFVFNAKGKVISPSISQACSREVSNLVTSKQ